jgi:hypothetical protein
MTEHVVEEAAPSPQPRSTQRDERAIFQDTPLSDLLPLTMLCPLHSPALNNAIIL